MKSLLANWKNCSRQKIKRKLEKDILPLTLKEFNEIIDKSEDDFTKGRETEARNLFNQIDSWK